MKMPPLPLIGVNAGEIIMQILLGTTRAGSNKKQETEVQQSTCVDGPKPIQKIDNTI